MYNIEKKKIFKEIIDQCKASQHCYIYGTGLAAEMGFGVLKGGV